MKIATVYLVTCSMSAKQYVGITETSLWQRWRGHVQVANRNTSRSAFHAAIRLYGEGAFSMEALWTGSSRAEANIIEKQKIASLNTLAPHGYNLTQGGDGGPVRMGPHTSETRQKMSAAATGKKKSASHVANMSACRTGKPLAPAHAAKIRLIGRGNLGKKHAPQDIIQARISRRLHSLVVQRPSISGAQGIYPDHRGWWSVRIKRNGKRVRLGTYETIEEAKTVYLAAATQHLAELQAQLSD